MQKQREKNEMHEKTDSIQAVDFCLLLFVSVVILSKAAAAIPERD